MNSRKRKIVKVCWVSLFLPFFPSRSHLITIYGSMIKWKKEMRVGLFLSCFLSQFSCFPFRVLFHFFTVPVFLDFFPVLIDSSFLSSFLPPISPLFSSNSSFSSLLFSAISILSLILPTYHFLLFLFYLSFCFNAYFILYIF